MDLKEIMLKLIDSESISAYKKYFLIEKLVFIMLEDYLKSQDKRIFLVNSDRDYFDMILPDGIDDETGEIAVELKISISGMYMSRLNSLLDRWMEKRQNFEKILLITVNDVPDKLRMKIEEKKNQLNYTLLFWDINDLVRIFRLNENLFMDTYKNINAVVVQETIREGLSRDKSSFLEKREMYIRCLQEEYENDNIVLFLGAGASKDANVATWTTLIAELFVALIDKELERRDIQLDDNYKNAILEEMINQNGRSPLLQTRFLRNGFDKKEFEELIRKILYKEVKESSELLDEIGQLCISNRGKLGIQAVINYNFDDLIEQTLKKFRVRHRSIYSEGMITENNELGIYHVHGFLPRDKNMYKNISQSLLVFSEDGYHKLMLEPYNWANICQLNYMINNTCVFIGLSMTDPNMRRLLEVAAQKRFDVGEKCQHYAILRRFKIQGEKNEAVKKFENVNETLQEKFYSDIDVNVIWVDEYKEIPNILKKIKNNGY